MCWQVLIHVGSEFETLRQVNLLWVLNLIQIVGSQLAHDVGAPPVQTNFQDA